MALKANMKSILVVDDEDDIRSSIVKILFDARFNVFDANSGNKALDILNVMDFDLVLTDVAMPNGNGLELVSEITKKESFPKIIFLTSYGEMINETIKKHVDLILSKPFKKDDLISQLKSILDVS